MGVFVEQHPQKVFILAREGRVCWPSLPRVGWMRYFFWGMPFSFLPLHQEQACLLPLRPLSQVYAWLFLFLPPSQVQADLFPFIVLVLNGGGGLPAPPSGASMALVSILCVALYAASFRTDHARPRAPPITACWISKAMPPWCHTRVYARSTMWVCVIEVYAQNTAILHSLIFVPLSNPPFAATQVIAP